MLGRLLRLADYRVNAFASGEEFLASLAAEKPACAVLDIHMPGLSGLEVQSRMRAAHLAIPVVFISASDESVLERSASEAGGRLLRKPFSSQDLLQAIGIAIDHKVAGP